MDEPQNGLQPADVANDVCFAATASEDYHRPDSQGARRHRLMGLNDPVWQVPKGPADQTNTQSAVWDVL
jgi:hypothetical protein